MKLKHTKKNRAFDLHHCCLDDCMEDIKKLPVWLNFDTLMYACTDHIWELILQILYHKEKNAIHWYWLRFYNLCSWSTSAYFRHFKNPQSANRRLWMMIEYTGCSGITVFKYYIRAQARSQCRSWNIWQNFTYFGTFGYLAFKMTKKSCKICLIFKYRWKKNQISVTYRTDFIFALITRHFIVESSYLPGWRGINQREKVCLDFFFKQILIN